MKGITAFECLKFVMKLSALEVLTATTTLGEGLKKP